MKELKPLVTNVKACMIETYKDPKSSTWLGEYRERIDFIQPWNGKRQRIIRFSPSVVEINYMIERLQEAKAELKERILKDFKG